MTKLFSQKVQNIFRRMSPSSNHKQNEDEEANKPLKLASVLSPKIMNWLILCESIAVSLVHMERKSLTHFRCFNINSSWCKYALYESYIWIIDSQLHSTAKCHCSESVTIVYSHFFLFYYEKNCNFNKLILGRM